MTPDQVDEIDRQKAASRAEDQADKIAMKHRGTYYRAGGRGNRGDRGARRARGARGVRGARGDSKAEDQADKIAMKHRGRNYRDGGTREGEGA